MVTRDIQLGKDCWQVLDSIRNPWALLQLVTLLPVYDVTQGWKLHDLPELQS
jgi:hypothetical protein